MRIAGWPIVDEGARIYFSHRTILRSYLVLVAILGLMLLLWWPRTAFDAVLRSGASTDTFVVVAVGTFLCLVYLSARYGSEGYSPDTMVPIRDYVTLTPVPIVSVVAGKLAFAFLHTLFLLALGAPFLLAALAVSGVGLAQVLGAFLVIGAAALAVRMYGLLLHVLFAGRRLPCTLALLTSVGLYFTLAQALGSPASPLMALLSLSPRQDIRAASLPVPRGVVPFYLAAACVLAAGVVMVLAMVKAHARKVTHNEK